MEVFVYFTEGVVFMVIYKTQGVDQMALVNLNEIPLRDALLLLQKKGFVQKQESIGHGAVADVFIQDRRPYEEDKKIWLYGGRFFSTYEVAQDYSRRRRKEGY